MIDVKTYQKEYKKNNKEKIRLLNLKWREENKELSKEKRLAFVSDNKEHVKATRKKWYDKNKKKILLEKSEYYSKNKEIVKQKVRHYREKNTTKVRALSRNYKAKKKNAEGKHTKKDIDFLFLKQKAKCAVCTEGIKNGFHVDHISPLARGGTNWPKNLQLLCQRCNNQKHAKDPIDFMQEKGFLL